MYIYIYMYIVIYRQTVALCHNSLLLIVVHRHTVSFKLQLIIMTRHARCFNLRSKPG